MTCYTIWVELKKFIAWVRSSNVRSAGRSPLHPSHGLPIVLRICSRIYSPSAPIALYPLRDDFKSRPTPQTLLPYSLSSTSHKGIWFLSAPASEVVSSRSRTHAPVLHFLMDLDRVFDKNWTALAALLADQDVVCADMKTDWQSISDCIQVAAQDTIGCCCKKHRDWFDDYREDI